MINIDIDRLHDVIEGKRCNRGDGQTFAMLVQVSHSVTFGEHKTYVVVVDRDNHIDHIQRLFLETFDALGYSYKEWVKGIAHRRYVDFDNDNRLLFVARQNLRPNLIGRRIENIFIDHWALPNLTPGDWEEIDSRMNH